MSATETAALLHSESANQVSDDDSAYVFVRYWFGFTDRAPYERLNVLSDESVEAELRQAIESEARVRGINIAKREAYLAENWCKRFAKRRKSAIARPRQRESSNRQNEPLATWIGTPRQQQLGRIIQHARLIGWFAGSAPVDYVVSPRVWIARADSLEMAEELVKELTNFRAGGDGVAKDKVKDTPEDHERSRNQVLNPKYGFTPASALSTHDRRHAANEAKRLRATDPREIWGSITRLILGRADEYIEDCRNNAAPESVCGQGKLHGTLIDPCGTTSATDLIWYRDIADIAGIKIKTVQTRVSDWKKRQPDLKDGCSYELIKPFLMAAWSVFPIDYGAMRQILALKRTDST